MDILSIIGIWLGVVIVVMLIFAISINIKRLISPNSSERGVSYVGHETGAKHNPRRRRNETNMATKP